MKQCNKCFKEKPLNCFSIRDKGLPNERPRNECKACLNKVRREGPNYGKWHKENKPRVKAYMRNYGLQRHYGISEADYQKLLGEQGHKCAINPDHEWGGKHGTPHVDHCHETGQIRGILCSTCNVGLGMFKNSIRDLEKAIDYLRRSAKLSKGDK